MIRTVNDVLPGVKRPFRLQDIEFVWEGLNSALASSVGSTPRILSGFNIKSDNNLSAGVIAFNGQLYMHPDTDGYRIPLDSEVYAGSAPSADDMRAFADGTVQNMYWYDVLSTNKTIAEGIEGVLVGAFTKANIEAWSAFGGGGGNTKTFNMTGIYGYLASANPTTITLNAETLNELSDALSLGKQIILTDMATYADEIYFMELSLYRRDGQTYYFSLRGYTATGSSTALTANGMGFKRSRGITINMTTGVVNTVTNNMVQLNVHSADGATQNIVSSYPNAVFNFPQNVLIKNVKVATIDGTDKINVRNPLVSNQYCALNNNGLDLFSPATSANGGISYLNSAGNGFLGFMGARVTGDTLNRLFLGWGSDPANLANQFYVNENDIKYKNVDVTLADSTKNLLIRNPTDDRYAELSSLGIVFKPSTTSSHGQGLYVTNGDRTKTLGQIGFSTNHNNLTDTQIYFTWGGASAGTPAKSLIVGEDNFIYKNNPILTGTLNGTYYNVGNGGTTNVKYNFLQDLTVGGSLVATMQKVYSLNIRDLLNNAAGIEIPFSAAAECVTYLDANYVIWVNDINTNRKTSARLVRGIQPGEEGIIKLFLIYMIPTVNKYQEVEIDVTNKRLRSLSSARFYQAGAGTIGTDALADGAVTTDKLANLAVTNAKLGVNAVADSNMQQDSVGNMQIKDNAVSNAKIATDAVTSTKIRNAAVTSTKLANASVIASKLDDGSVVTSKIYDGAVTKDKLATNSVWTAQLSDGAVTGAKIADGTITNVNLGSREVNKPKIAAGTIPPIAFWGEAGAGSLASNQWTYYWEADKADGSGKIGRPTISLSSDKSTVTIVPPSSYTETAIMVQWVTTNNSPAAAPIAFAANRSGRNILVFLVNALKDNEQLSFENGYLNVWFISQTLN